MPLKGGQVRGALRMLALSPARSAQVVPARPSLPQEKCSIRREQKILPRFLCSTVFDDTTTIYWGGSVRAQPCPHSPTHATTHLTLTHGPAAHAATNIFAFALLRVQVLVGDEQPPRGGCSYFCRASVRAGCSR